MSFFFKLSFISFALANVCNTAVILNETLDVSIPFQEADEHTLLELGEKVNSPLLKLIGFALKNLKCNINGPCDIWSPWTRCSTVPKGTFGIRTRSRSCYQEQTISGCDNFGKTKHVENQNEVCEGFCPTNYNTTSTSLCLKTSTEKKKRHAAEKFCEEDGGHIINIDTQKRYEAASSVANISSIWVQGKRSQQAGPWQYIVGEDPESQPFFKWDEGDPENGVNDVYMRFYKSEFYDCVDSNYIVICEIRQ
ncbi:uncharacterized protein LOC128206666 [Mya arenaria]|uniref:uncharacterized protein LOC128206666 n=1 Tax=Mya arenaria TaxID=6604 RepID=UPI0022E218DC|nr:uncharacterized protein LOC128206666 [Mya arenaria]